MTITVVVKVTGMKVTDEVRDIDGMGKGNSRGEEGSFRGGTDGEKETT